MVLIGDLEVAQREVLHYRSNPSDDERRREEQIANTVVRDSVPPRWYGTGKDLRHTYYKRQYSTRTCYYNYTDKPIIVVERTGIPMIILPDTRKDAEERVGIVMRREIFFDNADAAQRTLHAFGQMTPLQGEAAIKAQAETSRLLRAEMRNVTRYGMTLSTDFFMPLYELDNNPDGYLYHHATDVLLSVRSLADTPRHPASAEYTEFFTRTLLNAPAQGQNDLTLILRYVTDDIHATPKYVQVAGKILTLKPELNHPSKLTEVTLRDKRPDVIDEMCSEYIEVIYSASVDTSNPNTTGMRIRRIGLDEARTTYGVFDSYQEIASEKDVFEAQLRRLKDKNDQLTLELQREKKDADQRIKQVERKTDDKIREKDLKIWELEYKVQELERQQAIHLEILQAKREQVVHKQKVKFEFAKFVINLITVAVGLLPAIFKIFGAKMAGAK